VAPEPAVTPAATAPVGVTPVTPANVATTGTGITLQEAQYKALLEVLAAATSPKAAAPVAPAVPVAPAAPVPSVTALSTKAREAVTQRPAAVTKPAPAATTVAPAPAPVKPAATNQYWIQAAAFTSKNNADNARVALESAKIPGEVFTHTGTDGKIVYRVRVGPYTSKSEAEYWQSQIGQIKNFAGSQTFVVKS
jgi:cell division septation protein DedD